MLSDDILSFFGLGFGFLFLLRQGLSAEPCLSWKTM